MSFLCFLGLVLVYRHVAFGVLGKSGFVERMLGGKHALVEDAGDEDAFCRLAIEDDVAALFNLA